MKQFIFFFVLSFSLSVFGQSSDQKKILSDVQSMIVATETKDYDHILDLSHPKVFEYVDRNTLKSVFVSTFEGNDEFSVEIIGTKNKVLNISEIFVDGTSQFAFVDYPLSMKMTLKNENIDKEGQETMTKMMNAQGMDVTFLNGNTFVIKKLGMIIAINNEDTNKRWSYTNYDAKNPLSVKIIPVEVLKKANDYYAQLLIKKEEHAN